MDLSSSHPTHERNQPAQRLKRKGYEQQLAVLQAELVHAQEWVVQTGTKVMVVFEGRDGA